MFRKKFCFCAIVLFLFCSNISAEESDYFPLQIGNTWTYRQEYWSFDFDKEDYVKDWEEYITISIIDTITYEGNTYYLFDDNNAYYRDGLYIYKYDLTWDYEGLFYDFTPCDSTCTPGELGKITYYYNNDYQSCFVTRYDIEQEVPAGTFESFKFTFGCDTHIFKYNIIAINIGLIYRSEWFFENHTIKEWLVYAKVNGKEYGATAVTEKPQQIVSLHNYPNPFNPTTTITYTLPSPGFASIMIYNIMGQTVRELVSESMSSGTFSVIWDGKNDFGKSVSSGIYLSRLQTGKHTEMGRMLLMK